METKNKNLLAMAAIVALGFALNGLFIGKSLEKFKREDRKISVKGFSEKEVKSNFSVWTIKTRVTSNDLLEGTKTIEENKEKLFQFLTESGIQPHEIIQQNFNVTDKLARDYVSNDMGPFRYIVDNSIQVRSENVDLIAKLSKQTDKLFKAGVMLTENDYSPNVKFLYTRLNDIKPQMLSEATQNAKKAAIEFTKESGVKLGKLQRASQGLFSIVDRDYSVMANTGDGGFFDPNVNDIYKKVKVVVNIDYSIE